MVTTGVILMPAAYMFSMAILACTSKRFEMWRWELASLVTPSNWR